jgi:hypothetical protein
MLEIDVIVEVSEQNGNLVPQVQNVGSVIAGRGETTFHWRMITTGEHGDMLATFNSSSGIATDPFPEGVHIRRSGPVGSSGTEWEVEIENLLSTTVQPQNVNYQVNGIFNGQPFSGDPVIVVTGEPVGSGSFVS